ncbi:MAG: hypothetical protein PUG71_07900 [bacterium]|nr:hypothetical protein [bacterium]
MTDQDLKKLSRRDLLEMLIEQSKEVSELREKLNEAEASLKSREIKVNEAGSIAEAALQLNGVFEAAQAACQQYTDNICQLSQRQEEICTRIEAESEAKAKKILEEAQKKSEEMEHHTKVQCDEMVKRAKAESKAYWDAVSEKLELFYEEHNGLRDMLAVLTSRGNKE